MINLGHVICLYAGVALGWFIASIYHGYKQNKREDLEGNSENENTRNKQ